MAGFEDAYKRYTESGQGQAVAGMYDQQTQANVNSLKATYDQNLASQQAAREQIGTTYQNSANNMQAQYERNRRNLNQQAAANGINTGAGSQQQLALQNVWNRDYGALQGQQAQAYANADLAIAKLQTDYQNAIQQAQAQGDYRKMAALLDDYNTQYNRQLQNAKTLASYGDFSGYSDIYSPDQITNMRNTWIASNPLLAYNTGAIDAATYQRMTGQYAPGQAPAATSSDGASRYPTTPSTTEEPTTPTSATVGISPAAQAIIAQAQATGSTPQQIQRALREAVSAGLISQAEMAKSGAQIEAAAVNAATPTRAAQQQAVAATGNGFWTPSIGVLSGTAYEQAGYNAHNNAQAGNAQQRGAMQTAFANAMSNAIPENQRSRSNKR